MYGADLSTAYAYHRRVLRLLQWGTRARPWRLKAPAHMVGIAALANAFPDARFVMTHRAVVEVIPSIADLYSELAGPFTDELDRHYLGELNVETWVSA